MKEELEGMISNLKNVGFTISKIEKELNFSNGVIGKAISGKIKLNDEKFDLLKLFYEKHTDVNFELAKPENNNIPSEPKVKTPNSEEKTKAPQQSYFSKLLLEFNNLVADQPSVKSIKSELDAIFQKSANSELNYRQTDAIRARVINYMNGDYGNSRNQLKTS